MADIQLETSKVTPSGVSPCAPVVLPCISIIEQVKKMMITLFACVGILSVVMYLLSTFIVVSVTRKEHDIIKKECFAEVSRSRGELLGMIMKDRGDLVLIQETLVVYGKDITEVKQRLTANSAAIANKPNVIVRVETMQPASDVKEPVKVDVPTKKKSFWSKLCFWD